MTRSGSSSRFDGVINHSSVYTSTNNNDNVRTIILEPIGLGRLQHHDPAPTPTSASCLTKTATPRRQLHPPDHARTHTVERTTWSPSILLSQRAAARKKKCVSKCRRQVSATEVYPSISEALHMAGVD